MQKAEANLRVCMFKIHGYIENPADMSRKILIERFANGTSMANFFDSLDNIYRDVDGDPFLKNWFKTVNSFLR